MADGKFYHVYLRPSINITPKEIEAKMNLAIDWFCYDSCNWIVYSTSDAHKLFARLKPLAAPDGYVFVIEVNPNNRNGFMKKALWTWLRKDRSTT